MNACRHERVEERCYDLIISLLPSQDGSCCVKPIAALHLTVDGCAWHVDCTYSLTTIGSRCLEEMLRDM